jgi:hypothetical protein
VVPQALRANPGLKHDFYLSKAKEAETRAAQSSTPAFSQSWLQIARSWQNLALTVEREFQL